MTKFIIILGPPGSGKGTQAKTFSKNFNLLYFGTGDLMRQEAKKGTDLGKKFQTVWDKGKGELVRDELVEELVESKLEGLDFKKGIIFDGYPRTIKQAEKLTELLNIKPKELIVLNIQVSSPLLMNRTTTRRVCNECNKIFFQPEKRGIKTCDKCGGMLLQRQEDKIEIVKKRIEVYEEQTKPLIDYYKNNATFINIDGSPSIQKVTEEIVQKLKRYFKNGY